MARMARAEAHDPAAINVLHVFSGVFRRCLLLGDELKKRWLLGMTKTRPKRTCSGFLALNDAAAGDRAKAVSWLKQARAATDEELTEPPIPPWNRRATLRLSQDEATERISNAGVNR